MASEVRVKGIVSWTYPYFGKRYQVVREGMSFSEKFRLEPM